MHCCRPQCTEPTQRFKVRCAAFDMPRRLRHRCRLSAHKYFSAVSACPSCRLMPGALHLAGGSSASMGMRPVLIIIDMQEHFRDGMAERILPQLNSLIDACRRLGVPIIFTQVWDCMRGRAGGLGLVRGCGTGARHVLMARGCLHLSAVALPTSPSLFPIHA